MKLQKARKLYEAGKASEILDLENLPGGLEGVAKKIRIWEGNYFDKVFAPYAPKAVIGMSGGVDSALTGALTADALHKNKVTFLIMPSATSTKGETDDAIAQAEKLRAKYEVWNIQEISDAFGKYLPDEQWGPLSPSTLGNAKPRIRMALLYGWANEHDALVVGTDNKTEGTDHGMGYFTKYGDGGVDLNPISGLYKTQVWQLAKHVGVLDSIIKRKPTAGLFLGQADENELGLDYRTLDKVLLGFELGFKPRTIEEVTGVPKEKISEIYAYRMGNQHKGKMPPGLEVCKFV